MNQPLYGKCGKDGSPFVPARLTFPEILSDPLVRTLMRADRVDPAALETCLGRIAAKLAPRGSASLCPEPC